MKEESNDERRLLDEMDDYYEDPYNEPPLKETLEEHLQLTNKLLYILGLFYFLLILGVTLFYIMHLATRQNQCSNIRPDLVHCKYLSLCFLNILFFFFLLISYYHKLT